MSREASTAAIDRWIEPAEEPEPECLDCGHELTNHYTDPKDGGWCGIVWCDCKGFK